MTGRWPPHIGAGVLLGVLILRFQAAALAQATMSTGSIQGTVTDPAGGVIPGASIEVASKGLWARVANLNELPGNSVAWLSGLTLVLLRIS